MRVNFLKNLKENQFAIAAAMIVLLSGLRTVLSSRIEKSEWWLDPCDTEPLRLRHPRSAGTQQLYISINNIKELKKLLQSIYPNEDGTHHHGSCLKIKRLIQPVKAQTNKLNATIQFYISLTQLAMYLEKLRRTQVDHQSNIFSDKKRKNYYGKMKDNIKIALCEASYDIEQISGQKKLYYEKVKTMPKKNLKCVPKVLDTSSVSVYDFDFFNKIFKFLKQGRNHLRKLERKKRVGGNKIQRKKLRTKI